MDIKSTGGSPERIYPMNHTLVPDEDAGLIRGIASIQNAGHAVRMSARKSSPRVGQFNRGISELLDNPFIHSVN